MKRSLRAQFSQPEAKPRLRIICETVGPGKVNLLRLIDETHSISEAARRMRMSYPRAWSLINALNNTFKHPVVRSVPGGTRGGGSVLTPTGRSILNRYRAIYSKCLKSAGADLKALHRLLKPPR